MQLTKLFSKNQMVNEKSVLRGYVGLLSLLLLSYLFLHYVGEEGVYTNQAVQILYHHHLFDLSYSRPPLFAWLIIIVAKIIGYSHMLAAARLVCIGSFFLTGLTLFKLVDALENDRLLAWYCVAAFYTVQMVVKYAWLSYADPLFGMLTFLAVALLWLYAVKNSWQYLLLSLIGLFAAILTKTFTCLVVYGVAWWVFFFIYPEMRATLYRKQALFFYTLFIAGTTIFFYWQSFFFHNMIADMTSLERIDSTTRYLKNLLLIAPFDYLFYGTGPALTVALYALIRRHVEFKALLKNKLFLASMLIFFINVLPYWLSHHIIERRYLFPIYPFAAIFAGYTLYHCSQAFKQNYCKFLIVLALILTSLTYWPLSLAHRTNFQKIAANISHITGPSSICIAFGNNVFYQVSIHSSLRLNRYTQHFPNISTSCINSRYQLTEIKNTQRHSLLTTHVDGHRLYLYQLKPTQTLSQKRPAQL